MLLSSDGQVAVFIDYENIEISCRNILGKDTTVDWSLVLETAADMGRVVLRRAYADWAMFRSSQRELMGLGVDLVHVASSRKGKNAADIRIVIDALEMAMLDQTNVTHVLLVSGDGDFTELVHRLRAHGKIVVGMGISATSADFLIKSCDQFFFYDLLVDAPAKPNGMAMASVGGGHQNGFINVPEADISKTPDISEARQLLRRALQSRAGDWVSGGKLKSAMLRLDPAFNERNYRYDSFKDFLQGQSDMVKTRTAEGGHLEVQIMSGDDSAGGRGSYAPEALLDVYLRYLAQQKIRMAPNEHRPHIIMKFYDLAEENPDSTLNEVKEELHNYFEEEMPSVKWQYVHETIHQLFRTYCFVFDQEDGNYSEDTRLWDRKTWLTEDIKTRYDLLDKCDRGLIMRIKRRLPMGTDIDVEVAARLLYGRVSGQKMLDHVTQTVEKLEGEETW